jgi:branched-chain amino acid transport system substrate-binding protein
VRFDDRESVNGGLLVAQRIAADPDIVAVIGHLQSFISVPAAALYDLAGLVMIAPTSSDPELTSRGYRRVFRTTLTDVDIGRLLADFADRSGARRVGIEYIRNPYGRGLANAFEERAGEHNIVVAARQSYDPGEQVTPKTFEGTVREWRTLDLDAIFLAGEVPSAALFIAQARAQGIRAPIFGGEALGTPALVEVAGDAAEGTIVATMFHPEEPRDEVRRFVDAFQRRYRTMPDVGSAVGYDAVHVLFDAMRRAKSVAPDAVAAALRSTTGLRGVTGTFAFDEHGNIVGRSLVTTVVRKGRFALCCR